MAITDIQISEELETGAPSIKYRGNEGPKSPQQKTEYDMQEYIIEFESVFPEMKELRGTEEYMNMLEDYFRGLAKGPVLPSDEDPVNPFGPKPQGPVLPNRQMAAYGGIMGLDGRRQYGLGSSLKKRIRKLIPNEVAKVAEVAAPFVAPFNPLAAGLMKGVGGFDRTGSIGDSLKSGLMTYGLGQGARYLGGADLQKGLNLRIGDGTGIGSYFSSPKGDNARFFDDLFKSKTTSADGTMTQKEVMDGVTADTSGITSRGGEITADTILTEPSKVSSFIKDKSPKGFQFLDKFKDAGLDTKAMLGILGLSGAAGLYTAAQGVDKDMIKDMNRGEGLDIEGIRAEITEAMKDPSGKLLEGLRVKYPFLGTQASKNFAMGGRIGFAEGSSGEDFYLDEEGNYSDTAFKDKAKEIGGSYTGLLDFGAGVNMVEDLFTKKYEQGLSMEEAIKDLEQQWEDSIESGAYTINQSNIGQLGITSKDQIREKVMEGWDMVKGPETQTGVMTAAYGGRIGRAEGGLMNLGGMEKDYRAEGGFVPIGKQEKADDVPARLSVNEFVFTADAVRNAGGGDIDKGAEVMENMMKNLEAGGQVSQESQGMAGAQKMFETSERLSEVVA